MSVGTATPALEPAGEIANGAGAAVHAERMLAGGARPLPADERTVFAELQSCIDRLLPRGPALQILDAGCGQRRPVRLPRRRHVTGIDLDERQLTRNRDIDEAIVADLQTCRPGEMRFDAVICWNVLEHLKDPGRALENLTCALKPGGLMILAVPHAASVKGVLTKHTPFWFHRWSWRHLLHAEADFEPFPTVMSQAIRPERLCAFAAESQLTVELLREYEAWEQKLLRSRFRLTGRTFAAVKALVRALSFTCLTAAATDVIVVMRKAP
jgi:2-polyprenyl-3-methyl-5-hydroxy-6-metoxy-1,4-benzoquinol methylase